MKKFYSGILAVCLMFAVVSSASAALTDTNLVAVVYNDAQEIHLGLGLLSTVENASAGTVLGHINLTGMSEIAFYAFNDPFSTSNDWVAFATKKDTAPLVAMTSLSNAMTGMNAQEGLPENSPFNIVPNDNSFTNKLTATGSYGGINGIPSDGELFLTGNPLTAYLYQYKFSGLVTDGDNPYRMAIEVKTNGDIVVASQVPVPGALWLLGSALLGVVGLRKKTC